MLPVSGYVAGGVRQVAFVEADAWPQNHDLDFGIRQFSSLTSQCTFPWLLANVLGGSLYLDVLFIRRP